MSDTTPLVSVIIPVYNTASTLPRCIDSVLSQTYSRLEVVIVDDGSPDNAGAIADEYAARSGGMVRVVHKANAGLAEARRSGVHEAKGEWVMHIDSDDSLYDKSVVEFLMNKCLENRLDMAFGCLNRVNRNNEAHLTTHELEGIIDGNEWLSRVFYGKCIWSNCANVSNKKLWSDEVFPPHELQLPSEDIFINIMQGALSPHVGLFNKPIINYYYNEDSLSASGRLSLTKNWKMFFSLIEAALAEKGLLERHQAELLALKVEMLAFSGLKDFDKNESWTKQILNERNLERTHRTKILQFLLKHPALFNNAIELNRLFKRLLNRTKRTV